MASRVLVVSPHPDDESLGCGGTVCKHVGAGAEVRVVFLTSGEDGGHGVPPEETRRIRETEAVAACRILGVDNLEFWRLPDGHLTASRPAIDRLIQTLDEFTPDIVYVTHPHEEHDDHRAAGRLVRSAVLSASSRPRVLFYEVWTPLQSIDEIVDISDVIDIKTAAIRAHASQCAVLGFEPAFLGLARYRGEMHSWPGGPFAEAYEVLESR